MAERASQVAIEVLVGAGGKQRASQIVLEVLVFPAEINQPLNPTIAFCPFAALPTELRMPTNLSFGALGSASGWATGVVETAFGAEYRQGKWGQSLGRWTVGHNLRQAADWQTLRTLHRMMRGRHGSFRFQDWTDYQVTSGQGVLVANPAGQAQLAKLYSVTDLVSLATVAQTRLITKPYPGSVVFTPGGPTVDYTTGVVTGGTIGTTTWTGSFDCHVRFDTDAIDLSVETPVGGIGWRHIQLREVRLGD